MNNRKVATSYDDFDTDWYYRNYRADFTPSYADNDKCTSGVHTIKQFILDSLHEIFSKGTVHGERLLDVGTGASLISFLSASRYVKEIHLSDILPRHLDLMQKWRDGEDRENDMVEYVLAKENDGHPTQSIFQRLSELRRKVKMITRIDVRDTPRQDHSLLQYDIVTTCYCLESAVKSLDEYKKAVFNVAMMVKPGGFMVMVGILGESFYVVGEHEFWNVMIDQNDVRYALTAAGLTVLDWRVLPYEQVGVVDDLLKISPPYESMFVIVAQKDDN